VENLMDLPPLDLDALVTQWQLRPGALAAALLAAVAYLAGSRRIRRSDGMWPTWRTLSFTAGLGVVVIATCSGIEPYGRILQWVHMIEHLLLIMVAPALLAFGSPLQLAADAGAGAVRTVLARPVVSWLTSPVAAVVLYAVAVVGVHLTGLLTLAMRGDAVHVSEELAYLGAGFVLFQLTFGSSPGPWQLTNLGKLALLAVVSPVDTVVGVVLLQTGTLSIAGGDHGHDGLVRPDWAPAPADDTIAAGSIMWAGGTGIMALFMIIVGLAWLHGRQPARPAPSWTEQARRSTLGEHTGVEQLPADVDDDERTLAAYNAWLRKLDAQARPERPGRPPGG
jgi:putative copper resistance protein D